MPVGEVVTHVRQVGPDDAEPVLAEVLQPLRGVRIRGLAQVLIKGGGRGEDFAQRDEHSVVGGGQFGQRVGDLAARGGFTNPLGYVGDQRAEWLVVRLARLGVEGVIGVDVVAHGAQPGHGASGETFLLGYVETDGQAVIGLVEADDGDKAGALKDAVGFRIAAAGEDFSGVRVAPQGQEAIGKGQEAVLSVGSAGQPGAGRGRRGRHPGREGHRPCGSGQGGGGRVEVLLDAVQAAGDQLQLVSCGRAVGVREAIETVGCVLDEAAHGRERTGVLVGELAEQSGELSGGVGSAW